MDNKIELNWSMSSIIEGDFFPEDRLGRAKYATFLTKLLVSQSVDVKGQNKNYVLNLNAEWGAGKTYFLKRWANDIKEYYPVVYVDAWEKDYSDDPLMTVISSIISQLRTQAGKDIDDPIFKAPHKLIGLLKAAAPGIGRGLFKRYVGIDPVEIMNANDENESISQVIDEDGKSLDMSDAASQMVKHLIDEHDAKSKAIESLKKNVLEWVRAVNGYKRNNLPAFIFIDELDRCRPSYAVEMLETIKHIFNIEGVVFVVATDTEQLQHAVKAIYGLGFDAKIYLGRFFNSRYSLKAPNLENFLEVHNDTSKLSGTYFENLNIEVFPFNDDEKITLKNISVILEAFKMSVRTAIQITDRVIATITNMPKGSKIDILMLTTLLCIKEKDSTLFDEIISGRFKRIMQKTDGNKELKLNEFLKDYITEGSKNLTIEMNFSPQKYVQTFRSITRPSQNMYPSGRYLILLTIYIQEIFSTHFTIFDGNLTSFLSSRTESKTQEQSPSESIINRLIDEYKKNAHSPLIFTKPSILWMKYFYINNQFNLIKRDEYRDFVELASPLDWMGKDELGDWKYER